MLAQVIVAKQVIPCVIKIFSPSVNFLPELDEMGYIELRVIPKFTEWIFQR